MTSQHHIGKISEQEMSEMAVESYRQIAGRTPMTKQPQRHLKRCDTCKTRDCLSHYDAMDILHDVIISDWGKLRSVPTLELKRTFLQLYELTEKFNDCGSSPDHEASRPAPSSEEVNPWCYPGCILIDRAKKDAAAQAREDVLDIFDEFLNSDDHLTLYKWEVREKIRTLRRRTEGGDPLLTKCEELRTRLDAAMEGCGRYDRPINLHPWLTHCRVHARMVIGNREPVHVCAHQSGETMRGLRG